MKICGNFFKLTDVEDTHILNMKDLRDTNHYIVFRIGADTDIKNGRIQMVKSTLTALEEKEDYIACMALMDAINSQNEEALYATT